MRSQAPPLPSMSASPREPTHGPAHRITPRTHGPAHQIAPRTRGTAAIATMRLPKTLRVPLTWESGLLQSAPGVYLGPLWSPTISASPSPPPPPPPPGPDVEHLPGSCKGATAARKRQKRGPTHYPQGSRDSYSSESYSQETQVGKLVIPVISVVNQFHLHGRSTIHNCHTCTVAVNTKFTFRLRTTIVLQSVPFPFFYRFSTVLSSVLLL